MTGLNAEPLQKRGFCVIAGEVRLHQPHQPGSEEALQGRCAVAGGDPHVFQAAASQEVFT